ncbi:unnamed protein product [Lathyrus oleraceus]|uniref:Uncharacterized protein n=1 Tax=Pisum sativum TaxID=3888 RepID=A0A9D5H0J3_PEA|nr:late embryogenesis abundant protein At3g53040-like [Pisum sativum]KAI5447978.1 hypothetical protein KIW84_015423 [Pisum sativum]
MEAMLITRSTVVCHFSKPLPNVPSLSLHKPSTVFLASSSNHSHASYRIATKTRRGVVVRAAESISEGVEDIKKAALDANEKAKEVAGSIVDKAKEDTDNALKAGESAGEKAKEFASDAKDKTTEALGSVADKTNEGIETATEKAAEGTKALKKEGEKAEKAADGAWKDTKDESQKVKDAVVGKD